MTIIAAADGSAIGNPGPAGWAWYIDDERWRCGGWSRGTNNQGELAAVLDLLRQTAHSSEPLHVLCDSQYVINSITKWMAGWKRKGWKKADGKPVLNVEVMKALDEAMQGRSVTFEWVKGHAGHELNEKADALANGASKAHSSGKSPQAGPGFPGAEAVGAGEDPAAPPAANGSQRASTEEGRRPATGHTAPAPTAPPAAEPDLFSMDDDEPAAAARSDAAVDLVVDLERSLLTDAVRGDRSQLAALLSPSWRHICARGELWSLEDQLAAADAPDRASGDSTSMELIEARGLGSEVVLLVWREYAAGARDSTARGSTARDANSGPVLRSSVWQRSEGNWKQVFQQGTPEA